MRRFLTILIGIVFTAQLCFTSSYADNEIPESVECYITVTDITDANDPFNILADRIHLTVPYVDLTEESDFIFNPSGLIVENSLARSNKITYLHAIYALHKLVYGNESENLISKLYTDGNGDVTLFLGKIVATILYQNNDGVFTRPQCVELNDGDEVNICLYNYGHDQQIAVFDELAVTIQRNENITLHLNQYLPDPEDDIPIAGAYLTDSDGVYLLNSEKHIATTDENGEVTFNFAEGGLHRISIMPEIGYFLDTGNDDVKETSKPQNLLKSRSVEVVTKSETRTVTYDNSINGWYNLLDETADNYLDDSELQAVLLNYYDEVGEEPDPSVPVLVYSWDDEEETSEVPLNKNSKMIVKSTFTPEVVRYPVLTYDEPQPMVTYTMPFATINVDTTFVLDAQLAVNKSDGYETIYVDVTNSDMVEKDGVMPLIRVGRYTKDGTFIGWVGDKKYTYTNSAGDIFSVDGNIVTCTATNCTVGTDLTVLVYDLSVDNGSPLDDSNVVYLNQYNITSTNTNHTFTFQLRDLMPENEYKIVLNKNGTTTSQIVHIYDSSANWSNMSYIIPKTIAKRTGLVAFQFTAYPEDVDNDPDNDTVYKIFCWDWYENDTFVMGEPIIPPIILEPSTAQHEINRNNTR